MNPLKINIKHLLLLVLSAVLFIGCNKEPEIVEDPDQPFDENPFSVIWQDFITPEDVQILNADSSRIAISKKLVEKLGVTNLNKRTISIWRTMETIPFVRKVHNATLEGDYYILHSERGVMTDLFDDLDIEFSSELYVDHDYVPTKATRGGTQYEVDDVSGKYTDENGVIHPAFIYIESPEKNDAIEEGVTKSGTTDNGPMFFTAEELVSNNWEWTLVNIKDFRAAIDTTFRTGTDDDAIRGEVQVYMAAQASAKLALYGKLNVKRFKVKEFQIGLKGSAEAAVKAGLKMGINGQKEWEHSITKLGKTRMYFWVGPILTWYTCEPELKKKTTLEVNAHASVYASAKVAGEFYGAIHYVNSKWKGEAGGKAFKTYGIDGLFPDAIDGSYGTSFDLSAGLATGLYWETGVFFNGIIGPKYSCGPRVGIEAEAQVIIEEHDKEGTGDPEQPNDSIPPTQKDTIPQRMVQVNLGAGAYCAFGGDLGIKGKLFGMNILKFDYNYEIARFQFAKYETSYTYDLNKGTGNWENDWVALAKGDTWYNMFKEDDDGKTIPMPESEDIEIIN